MLLGEYIQMLEEISFIKKVLSFPDSSFFITLSKSYKQWERKEKNEGRRERLEEEKEEAKTIW